MAQVMTATAGNPVAVLNDRARQTGRGVRVTMTPGVAAMEDAMRAEVFEAVRTFDRFDEGNDPHGEHDFGAVEVRGAKVFFKFDYYDLTYEYGSDDPADPAVTRRVLTLMLASEY